MTRLIFTFCLLMMISIGYAQRTCGTMTVYESMKQADQNLEDRVNEARQLAREFSNNYTNKRGQRATITIPVVVHVMHNGEAIGTGKNISDAQILSQITVLNDDFRATNADIANVPSYFLSVIGNMDVTFAMAIIDPNGNATDGIDRVQISGSWSDNLKSSTTWGKNDYLNIWVADISGGTLGYATFPGTSSTRDGVVVDYEYYGSAPDNPFNSRFDLGRTATHEIGHWLGLYHTFEGGCSGTSTSNCGTSGDDICDTPPTSGSNFGCNMGQVNTCTESPNDQPDMQMNYMDYMDDACLIMFTEQQANVMLAVLNTSRASIKNSPAAGGAGSFTYDGQVINLVTSLPVENASVLFQSDTYSFELNTDANGNFSSSLFRSGDYAIYAGKWGYMTNLYNPNYSIDSNTTAGMIIPIDPGFYYDDYLMDFGWSVAGDASTGLWQIGPPVGTTYNNEPSNPGEDATGDFGEACYVTGNGGGQGGTDDVDDGVAKLVSPKIDLTGYFDPTVSYYAWFYNAGGQGDPLNDSLIISLSNGVEEVRLEAISGVSNSWDYREFKILDYLLMSDSMHLIVETGDQPNSGHIVEGAIDFFKIENGNPPTGISNTNDINETVKLYPNPTEGLVTIQFASESRFSTIEVFDLSGKKLREFPVEPNANNKTLNLSSLNQGFYFIRLKGEQVSVTKRVSLL